MKPATSPLAGKLFAEHGEPLTSTHAVNHGRLYRYYVSRHAHLEDGTMLRRGWRLPAREIERAGGGGGVLFDHHLLLEGAFE